MKKIYLAILLVASISGCGGGSSSPTSETPKTVLIARTPAQLRWDDAVNYCKAITIGGKTGWRLPTQPELSAYAKTGTELDGGAIWSSTQAQPTYHYWVSLNNTTGTATAGADYSYFYVRCAHD